MRSVRVVILLLASVSAAGAMWLMRSALQKEAAANVAISSRALEPAPPVAPPPPPSAKVLVANVDLRIGQTLTPGDLRWQEWPAAAVSEFYTTIDENPNAATDTQRIAARGRIVAGEPITEDKILRLDGSGVMAVLLRDGMRAVSVPISDVTGAGGFILPGDYVDLLLTRQFEIDVLDPESGEIRRTASESWTDTVLRTVRVLAIDQTLPDGAGVSAIGNTATLELTPSQVEVVTLARQFAMQNRGFLTLSLRSFVELTNEFGEQLDDIVPEVVFDPREVVKATIAEAEEARAQYQANTEKRKAAEAQAAVDAAKPDTPVAAAPAAAPGVVLIRSGVPIAVRTKTRADEETE